MRIALLAILLLSTAAPAFAQAEPDDVREQMIERVRASRAERQAERDERVAPSPVGQDGRSDVRASQRRMERLEALPPASAEQQPVLRGDDRGEALGRISRAPQTERMDERWRTPPVIADQVRPADTVATWRQDERRRDRIIREPIRRDGSVLTSGVVTNDWRDGWRRDRRYDWRQYRARNRSHFHLGVYIDPFGWGYRPIGYGSNLDAYYYSSRYALLDPWSYRLPLAPPGYRWVRYYDDALLIDLRSGRVVDVIRDLFW